MGTIIEVADLQQAYEELEKLEKEYGLRTYFGTGYPIEEPHILVHRRSPMHGEGAGYSATVYPEGDNGLFGQREE